MSSYAALPPSRRRTIGVTAIAATVLAWSGFALGIRGIANSHLNVGDVAMIRFLVPVLVLLPWLPRSLRALRRQRPAAMAAVMCGAGLPYYLIASAGGKLTTAALVGLVIPGSVPVFIAVLQFILLRRRPPLQRSLALILIVLGLLVILVDHPRTGSGPQGLLTLLLAGLVWAVYTTGIQYSTLGPVELVIALCVPSFILTLLLAAVGLTPSNILAGTAPVHEVLIFTGVHGVGVGLVAALGFTVAIRTLGADAAAATGALAPVVTAILGIPIFHEIPSGPVVVGLVVIVAGVALAHRSGRAGPPRKPPSTRPVRPHLPAPPLTVREESPPPFGRA